MNDNMFLRLAKTYNAVNEQWTKAAEALALYIRNQESWNEVRMEVDLKTGIVYITGEYYCYCGTETESIQITVDEADKFLASDGPGRKALVKAMRKQEDDSIAARRALEEAKQAEQTLKAERAAYERLKAKFEAPNEDPAGQ